mgnify:CR=1 FL=1
MYDHMIIFKECADTSQTALSASPEYRIVSMKFLQDMVTALACPDCGSNDIMVSEDTMFGLASKLVVICRR